MESTVLRTHSIAIVYTVTQSCIIILMEISIMNNTTHFLLTVQIPLCYRSHEHHGS